MTLGQKIKKIARKIFIGGAFVTGTVLAGAGIDLGWHYLSQNRRPLTDVEISKLRANFNSSIDYSKIEVSDGPISWFQKDSAFMTFRNTIYAPYKGDKMTDALLNHEATHVWQFQNDIRNTGVWGALQTFIRRPAYYTSRQNSVIYDFVTDTSKKLTDYNLEQQGRIMEKYDSLTNSLRAAAQAITDDTPVNMAADADNIANYKAIKKIVSRDISQDKDSLRTAFERKIAKNNANYATMAERIKHCDVENKAQNICANLGTCNMAGRSGRQEWLYTDPDLIISRSVASLMMPMRYGGHCEMTMIHYKNKLVYSNVNGNAMLKNEQEWMPLVDALSKIASARSLVALKAAPFAPFEMD